MFTKQQNKKIFFGTILKHDTSIYFLASFDRCNILTSTISRNVDINSFFGFLFSFWFELLLKKNMHF